MDGKHETRVLGRVLAVEETTHVSGAKPTLPVQDQSAPCIESIVCGGSPADSGTVADNSISMIPAHTSGT